jgi:ABC-type iron transport system FetAB ATPase subunit
MPKRRKPAASPPGPHQAAPPRLRLEWRNADELAENPANWKKHPGKQLDTLKDLMAEVDWAGALLYNEGTGRLIDGHARKSISPGQEVPVLIGNWTEAQEKKILATLDPLRNLAETDTEKLEALIREVQTGSENVAGLLSELAGHGDPAAGGGTPPKPPEIRAEYSIVVKCGSENDQLAILQELDRHGLDVKAVCAGFPATEPQPKTEPPRIEAKGRVITRTVAIDRTPRVRQLEGLFDVPAQKKQERRWEVDLPLDRPWHLGLIVGPSGSGKSTIARELFGDRVVDEWSWPAKQAIIDAFPKKLSIHDVTGLLSSVGFSSPPAWLKPYAVLSNGEKFRVNLARTLAEAPALAVVDEFTSVVDRTVAQIGSAALAKTVRATNRRFIAVTCHYDVEAWLQPDWKYDVQTGKFAWRELQRRPQIQLQIRRGHSGLWPVFRDHHYLSGDLNKSSKCFVATVAGQPAAFTAVVHNPHKNGGWWREHRTVCLPDFQGIGIGNALSEFVAGIMAATGKKYRSTTSHPAMIRHRVRSPAWRLLRAPNFVSPPTGQSTIAVGNTAAIDRATAGFEYVGPTLTDEAYNLGILKRS